jgi:outer membrane receptor protein involved in Fe transport
MSEISFQKGNPFLTPEIVNNIELGYTYAYRFNFKLGYSKTDNQITRLIAPSKGEDPRDNFISWDNIAKKTVISFSASLPLQVTEWWSAYMNIGASHINNQADYGDDAVIDVQAFTYSIYQQHTFNLIKGIKGEISGYFSGPGIWGGVFKYEETWSLNIGLQRKFFEEKLNVRLSANDLFYESGWNGVSVFDGLRSVGNGRWDSRNVAISLSYNFGNQNVKSRKRKIGLENEAGRVGG